MRYKSFEALRRGVVETDKHAPGTELEVREITPEEIYGKLSTIPAVEQRESVQELKAKLLYYKHLVRCLDCLGADAHCDMCSEGARVLRKWEKCTEGNLRKHFARRGLSYEKYLREQDNT